MKSPSLILKVWIPFWQGLSANLGQLTLYFTHIEIMKHYEYKIHFRNRHSLNVRKKKIRKNASFNVGTNLGQIFSENLSQLSHFVFYCEFGWF